MSNRIEKVNSLLQKEISKIILKDFDFSGTIVTVIDVDTTANLIEAKACVSVLQEDRADEIVRILNKEVYSVQQKINKLLNMRPIPKIKFVKDYQIASASKIEGILEKLKKKR